MSHFMAWVSGVAALVGSGPALMGSRLRGRLGHLRRDAGQAVTEYTLVILVAATVALLLLNWVNSGAVAGFFDTIFNQVTGMFTA